MMNFAVVTSDCLTGLLSDILDDESQDLVSMLRIFIEMAVFLRTGFD